MIRHLQHKLDEWRRRNFPNHTWSDQFMGVAEEVGELAHHLLKQHQGIRGDWSVHEHEAKDAVGDIVIYLMGLCSARGWDLEDIIEDTVRVILERDWQANPQTGVSR